MNIAFAKIGKSIKFKTAYSPIGGDNEAPAVFCSLVNNNPDKTFYLVGRSDFNKLSELEKIELFPYDNVINCYENCKSVVNDPNYIIRYFKENNISIDFAVMMIGQIGTVTIPDRVEQVRDRNLIASVIDMTRNYSTPIINWLNEEKPKWIQLINDPRYTHAQSRDFIHEPVLTLSQYDFFYSHNRIKSFEDQDRVETSHDCFYSGIETAFCVDKEYPTIKNIKKNDKFMIVLNEGSPSRYSMLKEWILDSMNDVEIYGKWECKDIENDLRFKGPLKLDQVQQKVKDTRYTFIIPIRKGWVTSKYIEMIHAGCIPFFHPTYDEQYHLDVPDALRVKKPEDLYNRIDYLERHPEERIKLLEQLQDILKYEYYDGTYLNNLIMGSMIPNYTPPKLCKYQKVQYNTLF